MKRKFGGLSSEELRMERVIHKIETDESFADVVVPSEIYEGLFKEIEEYEKTREKKQDEEELKASTQKLSARKKKKVIKGVVFVACIIMVVVGVVSISQQSMANKAYEEAESHFDATVLKLPIDDNKLEDTSILAHQGILSVDFMYQINGELLVYNVRQIDEGLSYIEVQDEEIIDSFVVEGDGREFVVNQYYNKTAGKAEYKTRFRFNGLSYMIISELPQDQFIEILKSIKFD